MKAYTLRIDEELLDKLKHLCIEEGKTVREVLIELIKKRIAITEGTPEEEDAGKIASILGRLEDGRVFQSIREDRER